MVQSRPFSKQDTKICSGAHSIVAAGVMRLACIIGSLFFVCHCAFGFGGISHWKAQRLLNRLDNARGSRQSIEAFKVLVKLSDLEDEELNSQPISAIIGTVEEIIVISMHRAHSTKFLNQVESKIQEISSLSSQVDSEMSSLGWDSRFLFGNSLSKATTNYLNHELQSIRNIKGRLLSAEPKLLEHKIQLCLHRCRVALAATLKTMRLMHARDAKLLKAVIQKTFENSGRSETKDLGKTLAVSLSVQQNGTVLEDNIKYLRENLAVILKSGVFMVFCFTFEIYVCSFIFGVLLTMSTIVWIAVFLQLIDV